MIVLKKQSLVLTFLVALLNPKAVLGEHVFSDDGSPDGGGSSKEATAEVRLLTSIL